jgi:uncharacterized RDD family membrane protein YckC
LASSWSSSPEAGAGSRDYAGFWPRTLAFLIDWLLVVVISMPVIVLAFGAEYFSLDPERRAWDLLTLLIVGIAVISFWRYCGATPGKLVLALKVVDAKTGEPPSTGRLVLRFVCYLLSALPLYLGFLWIAVDRRKQGWHDKIAGTVVIHTED